MRGKGKMGNPFSLSQSALKKVWGRVVLCFLAVSGFFGSVNVDEPWAWNYSISSDMSWYDYLHSGKSPWYGGGRVIQAGDTLEIRNGATLTFDFENKEKMYRRFALAMTWDKLSESGPVVSEDISITGSGTIRGIGDKGLQGLYSTAVITVTDINLLFQDFFYGFYAKVDETTPKESVINVTNNITQLENVYCGMNAKNAAISLTTGTFTVAGGEIAVAAQGDAMVNIRAGTANLEAGFLVFARDSAQVNISADIANLEASYLVYTRDSAQATVSADTANLKASYLVYAADSAQATLTAQKAGTLQGGVGAYDTSHVTVSLGGTAAWTGFSDKDDGASVSVTLGSGNIWNVRPVYTDGTNYGPSAVSSLSLSGGTVSLDSAAEFQRLNVGSLDGSDGLFRLKVEHDSTEGVDQVDIGRYASGSSKVFVASSGRTDISAVDMNTWLVRRNEGAGTFSLANPGQQVDLGMYIYRLSSRQKDGSTEWFLSRDPSAKPSDGDKPTPDTPGGGDSTPDTPGGGGGHAVLSPTGEAEAALSGLAGHYAMWYGQLTDLRKRLGEMRSDTQTGLWVRGFADAARLEGFADTTFTQTTYGASLGYDAPVFASGGSLLAAGIQLRGALARQNVNGSWGGNGDLKSAGCGLYATWLGDGGWYADAVGTIDWYNHRIRSTMLDGTRVRDDRSSYGLGASLEAGRRFDFAYSNEGRDFWFLEPQLELSYFWVKGGDFEASNGMEISQKDMDSLTGRAGVVLGRKFALDGGDGGHYIQPSVKGGVNREFLGRQKASFNGEDMTANMHGTRVYYGLGVDWQAADTLRLYMQAERESGDHYTREYNVSAGVKWDF